VSIETRPGTIWIEVDDLIRYFDGSFTPTGIGRVQLQVLPHLAQAFPDRIKFCRFGSNDRDLELLEYRDIAKLTDAGAVLLRIGNRPPLIPILKLCRYIGRRIAAATHISKRGADLRTFSATVKPGDTLVSLGASWTHRNFAKTIQALKTTHDMRFAILIHDILPISHPQLVPPATVPVFAKWLSDMADVWDLAMTQSRSSANALTGYVAARHRAPRAVPVIRFGAGFTSERLLDDGPAPSERSHVLYVSTIEIRKNHMLLFRIWERLLSDKGSASVPELVFAGKYGWEIQELRQALSRSRFLNAKIKVVENLSDNALADLYRHSLFTVFPSFCEGWGLPVAESLYHGRYCIASNATSIPEIGGDLLDYHDPSDLDCAYRLIERAISDRAFVAGRELAIRDRYTPPSWRDTANDIIAAIDGTGAIAVQAG
jgi:glycosyltransferase involved in cell wall biosynthesis